MPAQATLTPVVGHSFTPRGSRALPDGQVLSTWKDDDHVLGGVGSYVLTERFVPAAPNGLNHRMEYQFFLPVIALVDGVYVVTHQPVAKVSFTNPKIASPVQLDFGRSLVAGLMADADVAANVANNRPFW